MVGVRVLVAVRVSVGVRVGDRVNVGVRVGVEVRVLVGVRVACSVTAAVEADCTTGCGANAKTHRRSGARHHQPKSTLASSRSTSCLFYQYISPTARI